MKTYKTNDEFKVGKYNIGFVSSLFEKYFGNTKFEERPMPTFQELAKRMTDSEIENELKVGLCELGDILAFLENPPEKSKDGYANLFYTSSCVVSGHCLACLRKWDVD